MTLHRTSTAAGTALAAFALALLGCDGSSSPTAPEGPPSTAAIVVDDPAGALAAHEPLIRELIGSTFDQASRRIPVSGTAFTVTANAGRAIQGWGIGGFTLGPSAIDIPIDPNYPGLGQVLVERLPPIAAHELHHVARWRGPGPGFTLFESMISEGLADHFANELLGGPLPPWSTALSPAEIERYLRLAEPELDQPNDYDRWFFGFDPDVPRWTGYSLGFHLVAEHKARTGQSASALVHTPASAFRPE